jgi:IMP dehydrogenase/GMP reductase
MKDELFSFDDVLLKPQYSNVMSRKDVDLSTSHLILG